MVGRPENRLTRGWNLKASWGWRKEKEECTGEVLFTQGTIVLLLSGGGDDCLGSTVLSGSRVCLSCTMVRCDPFLLGGGGNRYGDDESGLKTKDALVQKITAKNLGERCGG